MTACRVSRRAASLVTLVFGAVWAAVPVGQTASAQSITAPIPLQAPVPMDVEAPSAAPSPPGSSGEVRVQALDPFDPDGVGLIEPPEGLGPTIWHGTNRSRAEELITRLSQPVRSRATAALLRRLLLSIAAPPAGRGTRSFLALKAEQLAAQGDLESAAALLRATPTPVADPGIQRLHVDHMLLAADTDGACTEIRTLVRNSTEPYWLKVQIFCQIMSGQRDAAAFSLDVLREQGQLRDPVFETLAQGLIRGREPNIDSLPNPTALHLAMLRAAHLAPPPDAIQTRDVWTLAAIANGGSSDLLQRIGAAERLEALGAFRAEALSGLYDRVQFRDEEVHHALAIAEAPYGVRARALLYRAAERLHDEPEARAKVVERAIALARAHGLYETALRINAPFILELSPSADLAALADDAARVAIAAGRDNDAEPWIQVMRGRTTAATPGQAAALDIALRLARGGGTREDDRALLQTWARGRKSGPDTAKRAAIFAVLLDAFRPLDEPEQWKPPLAPDIAPNTRPPLSRDIRQAAADGRKGEVVLLALILLGGQDPATLDPAVLGVVIPAMIDVGLEAEAREIAVEVAMAGGP